MKVVPVKSSKVSFSLQQQLPRQLKTPPEDFVSLPFFGEHKNHNEETQMEYLLSIESCKELELSGGCRRIPCYRMTHSWSYTYGVNIIISSPSISALAAILQLLSSSRLICRAAAPSMHTMPTQINPLFIEFLY